MRKTSKLTPLAVFFLYLMGLSCPMSPAVASEAALTVYTVNYPLQYFAERIGRQHAKVIFPAPADVDPAFWKPDVKTVVEYQRADLILLNGANYAKWIDKVTLPQSRLVTTSAGFKAHYIYLENAVTHSHGPSGEHSHTGTAFTTWLDFTQAVQQAKAVLEALRRKRPQYQAVFEENFAKLEQELLALDKTLQGIVAKNPDQPFLASHPIYQYLARRYGLNLQSVLWEPNIIPDATQWQEFESRLSSHPARWMIWEAEPNPESMKRLNQLGVKSLVFDPCANKPEQGDFMTVMQANVHNLRMAFK